MRAKTTKRGLGAVLAAGMWVAGSALAQGIHVGPGDTVPGTEVRPQAGLVRPATRPVLGPSESHIDVVFALDTTGSMSGLIEAAKQKIWSIVNSMATSEPRPRIRLGLVAYRDRGDEYVTRITPLTEDLDLVYADLMALVAAGGGDGPESVNQALHEALTRMEWTSGDAALKLVYLVGDAEPHMDYADDVKYLDSCALAASSGIFVNAIQCGSDERTAQVWREVASRSEGRYFAIDPSGGVQVVPTPFDGELAALSRELEGTLLHYGKPEELKDADERRETADRIAAGAPAPAVAERAVFQASASGEANLLGRQELVSDLVAGRVELDAIPEEELPRALRDLAEPERQRFVEEQAKKRADVQAEIRALADQREGFLSKEREKAGADDGFDSKVLESLSEQAAKKGIRTAPPIVEPIGECGTVSAPATSERASDAAVLPATKL